MLNTTFPPWPSYTDEEGKAIYDVLLSNKVNYWTGTETRKFENEFAELVNCKYAVAVSNGTLALDLALKGLNIQPGDEIVVTPRTFIASVSCVVNAGAIPVFADVDLNSQNISARSIEKVLTNRTKAIVVVHLAGMPADMDPIMELASDNDIFVIEDCAQAHGAKYKGRSVGSIGDIGAWSFCQDKIMTTGGEGGIVTTNNEKYWEVMWSYKDHGKNWNSVYGRNQSTGYRWIHDSIGTNWRMTELQAALGRIQIKRLPDWSKIRRNHQQIIWDAASNIEWLRVPRTDPDVVHAAYKAYVFVVPEQLPDEWSRERIIQTLNSLNIPAYTGSCSEVYLEKAFDTRSFRPHKRLANAKELGETSLMFLCHPTLETSHIGKTIEALRVVNESIKKSRKKNKRTEVNF